MKHIRTIIISLIAFLAIALLVSVNNNVKLRDENKILNTNVEALCDSVSHYKVADSLNAVTVAELQFKKDELLSLRKEDQEIIKQLTKKVKLQTAEVLELKNKLQLSAALRDTVFVHSESQVDSAKIFNYNSKWTDIKGVIYEDSVSLSIENREALIITESLEKKKLGCIKLPIWLFGYKNKRLDVVSKNPNTIIESVEYINIR